jgi:hypothetical protein
MADTYINVKLPPYNATGDGVTDDYPAIIAAINDNPGRTIYFPVGTYLVGTNIVPASTVHLLGDGKESSVIKAAANMSNYIVNLPAGSSITDLTVDGNLSAQSMPFLSGIKALGNNVRVVKTRVRNVPFIGIVVGNVVGTEIRDCEVDNASQNNIWVQHSPKTIIYGSRISRCGTSNILLFYSPESKVMNNVIGPSGPVGNGIYLSNTDRVTIEGNIITRCRGGIELGYDLRDWTQDILITGNIISGNYNGGVSFYANGVVLTGNQISKNGHGGINSVAFTIEPGIKIDPSYPGSGYVIGDILTLSGGTGTAAKVMVVNVFTGGKLYVAPGTDSALWPIDMGSYTSFPSPNPVVVSGGHGSGARVIYTNSKIGAGGSGYAVGDVLRATNPGYTQVVRVVVTAVSSGAVTGYDILNGGGYSGALPLTLTFANDWGSGTGFTLTPAWGKRYSSNYAWTFGVEALGPLVTGIISGNTISSNTGAPGILFYDQPPLFDGRAQQFVITSNILRDNAYSIKGKTGAGAFDDTWPASNIIANNIGYP